MMPLYCNQGHENQPGKRFCLHCGQPIWLSVGHILEQRYRIQRHLSSGGFGRTYLASDLHRFNERCVLKEFAPQVESNWELQKAKELFEREASALYQLAHPQLPKFREFFKAKFGKVGCLFLAQDYVEGKTYWDLLKSQQCFSEAKVTDLMCKILPVLSYIHSRGVIHRDISPDNVIMRLSDSLPVLIDFGGVKQLSAHAAFNLAIFGRMPTRLGKEGYAPGEQMQQGQVLPSSDLYSLAVTALVLLTGKEPKKLYDSYQGTWLWQKEIRVSTELETVLQKMLAYKPNQRYQSAEEVLQALQAPSNPPLLDHKLNSQLQAMLAIACQPDSKPTHVPIGQQSEKVNFMPTKHKTHSGFWLLTPVFFCKLILTTLVVSISGVGSWALVNAFIHSKPFGQGLLSSSALKTRNQKLHARRQTLGINQGFFNNVVNELFYAKHPQLHGRSLTPEPEDTALREEWYKIAEELLDKLEQAKLSPNTRHKLGNYSQQDYKTWQQKARLDRVSSYTLNELEQQTNARFDKLFPQQEGQKLNLKTFGQIWYALALGGSRE